MILNGSNIIGADFSAGGSAKFSCINPLTGERLPYDFSVAENEEIQKAVRLSTAAFLTYRKKSGIEKAAFLEAIAKEIEDLDEELILRCHLETALPKERLVGEKGRTIAQLRLFAALLKEGSWVNATIDTADPDRKPFPKPDIRSMQIALGPVAIFGASNFPLAFSVAGGDTVSALAAGCTVVVKAHEAHAGTAEIIGKAIGRAVEKCDMPAGVFSMLHGGIDVGTALVKSAGIKAVGFTGSTKGGKAIFELAMNRDEPIPVFAEMGSSNPIFILPGAIMERGEAIAKDFIASVNLGVGQFCTNPGILVTESEAFLRILAGQHAGTNGGAALSVSIQQAYKNGIENALTATGVSLIAKSEPVNFYTGLDSILLQVSAADFLESETLTQEIFGPSSLLVLTQDKNEMMQVAERLDGHLTATVFGTAEDLKNYVDLIRDLALKVGRLIINGYPTGVEVCHSMIHGGPYPATTSPASTSVGTKAIYRFTRPLCYQGFPEDLLPVELLNNNPNCIWRMVNGQFNKVSF